MNCQDIERILDDGLPGEVDADRRAAAEAHMAGCADCAAEWRVHQGLVGAAPPPMPAGVRAEARQLVAASQSGLKQRAPGRLVLLGAVMAVAAAAAVLVMHVQSPTSGDDAEVGLMADRTRSSPGAASPTIDTEVTLGTTGDPAATPSTSAVPAEQEGREAQRPPYRIMIRPMETSGLDETSARILDLYHAAFTRAMARIPGLVFMRAEEVAQVTGEHMEIRIRLTGVLPEGARVIGVESSVMSGGVTPKITSVMTVAVQPDHDIESLAARQAESLRLQLLPGDASRQEELYANLLDPAAPQAARQEAMRLLLSPSFTPADTASRKVVFRAALEQIASERDPTVRAATLSLIGNRISPELYEEILQVLDRQLDPELRLSLVTMLGVSQRFQLDPRQRASMQSGAPDTLAALDVLNPAIRRALEEVAESDPRQLTRMVARRALSGDAEWNQYVVGTLKDASLPDVERLEPFAFLSRSSLFAADTRNLPVDAEAIDTLGTLVSRIGRNPQQSPLAIKVINGLAGLQGTSGRDALLEILDARGNRSVLLEVRNAALVAVMSRHGADPDVRSAVEDLAAASPDPAMRQRAAQVLKAAELLAKEGKPLFMLEPLASTAP